MGERAAAVERQARHAFASGVDAVQLREAGFDGATLHAVASAIAPIGRLIITERADIALASGAAGVHLRGDGADPARVRALVGEALSVSRAVHTVEEAARFGADPALDWLVAGTVFASVSKPDRPPLGEAGLAAIAGASARPVVAIGGITAANAGAARAAGAAGIAAIGLFLADFRAEHVDLLRARY